MHADYILISADSGVGRPSDHVRSGTQIARFGTTPGGRVGDWVADQIGGSVRGYQGIFMSAAAPVVSVMAHNGRALGWPPQPALTAVRIWERLLNPDVVTASRVRLRCGTDAYPTACHLPSAPAALRRVLGGCQPPAHSVVAFGMAQPPDAYPHGHARLRAGTRGAVELRGIVCPLVVPAAAGCCHSRTRRSAARRPGNCLDSARTLWFRYDCIGGA